MQQVIAEDKDIDLKLVLVTFPDDGKARTITVCKNGEAIHLSIPELFVLQKLVNQSCNKFLRDKL